MYVLDGRYRLDEQVGSGGMAVVWRGYDLLLRRKVAVKTLTTSTAPDLPARDQVRAEAQAVARLSHPHIATVFDVGEHRHGLRGRTPYIVMEYVEGCSLRERLRQDSRLPWRSAAAICCEVAAALSAAHEHGIVHLDVKPGNVMLSETGVKVVDFGIAAAIGQPQAGLAGTLLGTPGYTAPERLRGDLVTPASDVYSLGMLLYRCLTGRLPWPAAEAPGAPGTPELAYAVTLPPVPGVPSEVVALCNQCLRLREEERPSSRNAATVLENAAADSVRQLGGLVLVPPAPAGAHPGTATLAVNTVRAAIPTAALLRTLAGSTGGGAPTARTRRTGSRTRTRTRIGAVAALATLLVGTGIAAAGTWRGSPPGTGVPLQAAIPGPTGRCQLGNEAGCAAPPATGGTQPAAGPTTGPASTQAYRLLHSYGGNGPATVTRRSTAPPVVPSSAIPAPGTTTATPPASLPPSPLPTTGPATNPPVGSPSAPAAS